MNKIINIGALEDSLVLQRVAEMERERYGKWGDYSVTDLINPPRVVHLKKRYGSVAKPKLASIVGAMMGTAIHEYFEKYLEMWCDKHDYDGYNLEEQVLIERQDRRISGRYDIREGSTLNDLKSVKVWKLIFDPQFDEFHEQQNLYRLLIKLDKGIEIDKLNITAIYKDWQKGKALRDRAYPQQQVLEYELTLWPYEETEEFLNVKLAELIRCEELPDEDLPVCTREERWERHQGGETIHYGILKNRKAARATKLVKGGTLDEALVVARGLKGMTKDSVIEVRYAQPKRCIDYCDICDYCGFYKNWCSKNDKEEVNDYITFKV